MDPTTTQTKTRIKMRLLAAAGIYLLVAMPPVTFAQSMSRDSERVGVAIDRAYQVLAKERQGVADRLDRQAAFAEAARLLDAWLTAYMRTSTAKSDVETIRYGDNLFRVGVLYEYARKPDNALAAYREYQRIDLLNKGPYATRSVTRWVADGIARVTQYARLRDEVAYAQQLVGIGVHIQSIESRSGQNAGDTRDPQHEFSVARYLSNIKALGGIEAGPDGGLASSANDNVVDPDILTGTARLRTDVIKASGLTATVLRFGRVTLFAIDADRESVLRGASGVERAVRLAAADLEVDDSIFACELYLSFANPNSPNVHNLVRALFGATARDDNNVYADGTRHMLFIRRGLRSDDVDWTRRLVTGELIRASLTWHLPRGPWWFRDGVATAYETIGPNGPVDDERLYRVLQALPSSPGLVQRVLDANTTWPPAERDAFEATARYLILFLNSKRSDNVRPLALMYRTLETRSSARPDSPPIPIKEMIASTLKLPPAEFDRAFANFVEARRPQ